MEASGRVKKGELTKTQLIAILKQRGEKGYSRLTRPQLLQRVGDQEDIPLAQLRKKASKKPAQVDEEDIPLAQLRKQRRKQRREQGPGFSPVVQAPVQRVAEDIPLALLRRPQGPGYSPVVRAPVVQAPVVRAPAVREQKEEEVNIPVAPIPDYVFGRGVDYIEYVNTRVRQESERIEDQFLKSLDRYKKVIAGEIYNQKLPQLNYLIEQDRNMLKEAQRAVQEGITKKRIEEIISEADVRFNKRPVNPENRQSEYNRYIQNRQVEYFKNLKDDYNEAVNVYKQSYGKLQQLIKNKSSEKDIDVARKRVERNLQIANGLKKVYEEGIDEDMLREFKEEAKRMIGRGSYLRPDRNF